MPGTLSDSMRQIDSIVANNKHSLGSWNLLSYRKFLAGLPSRIKDVMEVEDGNRHLVLENLHYVVPKDLIDPQNLTKIREEGRDLTIPLRGSFALMQDGKVISKSKPRLLSRVPFPTDMGTFILGGQEFNVSKQLRLSPGVYVTKGKDRRVKAQVNSSTRQNMDIYFHPDKHKFTFHIGGRAFPLHPIMAMLGVSEDQMQKAWGHTLYARNKKSGKIVRNTTSKLFNTMYKYQDIGAPEENIMKIREAFAKTEVDPWVTNVTLGKEFPAVTGEMLLAATQKALRVSAGKEDEDEREALYFKKPFGVGGMVNYALERNATKIRNKIKARLRKSDDIDTIVSRPLVSLGETIKRKYNEDELSRTPDQHNPLGMYHDNTEITFLGEGGISNAQMVTDKARGVHDSMVGFIDPLHTPEGHNVGMNIHLSDRAIFEGDRITQEVKDRLGEPHKVSPRDMYGQYVALPGQVKFNNKGKPQLRGTVDALYKGKITEVPSSKVNLIMHGTPNDALSGGAHIPFVGHDMGIRAGVGIKQMGQALPLKNREAMLVRPVGSSGRSVGSKFYRRMNVTAPEDMGPATVTRVTDNNIYLKDADGKSHKIPMKRHYQINGNATINDEVIVKAGDRIIGGQVLAENQYSKDGETAIGANLDVAFTSFYGMNHQDGVVISEEAARKMTSLHSYEEEASRDSRDVFNKKKFLAHYPTLYKKLALDKLDGEGIIKPGQVIEPGDPYMLKMTPQTLTEDDILAGNINKAFKKPLRRDEKIWDGDHPAIVRKVVKTKKGIRVYLETEEPAQIGDKFSNRHGAKGIVTNILSSDEMPKYEDGTTPDILQAPPAVPSRMNIGQIEESLAGRLALKRGTPYEVQNFLSGKDTESLSKEMLSEGIATMDDRDDIDTRRTLILPNGRTIKAFGGPQYFSKLKQQAASYYSARGRKDKYDIVSRRPSKGPKMGALGMYGMLAHGATENLKEISGWKGERNDDIWRAYETGQTLPTPKTTFALDRMIGILNAAGINVEERGDDYQLLPLTDEDVDKMSNGEVEDPATSVRVGKSGQMETLESYKGGLYDQKLFGGMQGKNYGHITLASKMPNPVFETPIKKLTGLTSSDYDALIAGDKGVLNGKVVDIDDDNRSHVKLRGAAFETLLGSIDVQGQLDELSGAYKGARGQNRDNIAKRIRYLTGLKRTGKKPTDYLISKLPVIAPQFRPVYLREDNSIGVSDLTMLYQRVGIFNQALKDTSGLPDEVVNENYLQLYNAARELQTTGRTEGKRQTLGALAFLKGGRPKTGHFMSKILAKREAIGGQATIMPDPKLDIDEIRIPDKMAWKIFEPKLMRRMVQSGIDAPIADEMIEKKTTMASNMLNVVMEDNPVIIRRDPKLHKLNMMAFRAKRTPGNAIYIPPLITKGFNADFDGDKMSVTVPIGDKAVKEAWDKLLPSKNLLKPGQDRPVIQPTEETVAGLYAGSRIKKQTGLKFDKSSDVKKAYDSGELKPTDGISFDGKPTTVGRVMAMDNFPAGIRDYNVELTDKNIEKLLQRVAEERPRDYGRVVKGLKDTGDIMATEMGLSFRAKDFIPIRDKPELTRVSDKGLSQRDQAGIQMRLRKHLGEDSILTIMADSGAKGSWGNIQQMLYSPVQVQDTTGRTIPRVIQKGYAEGMSFRGYWDAAKGSRKGIVDKGVETARPGYFGKEILRSSLGGVIQKGDSDEVEGIDYPVEHPTVLNRYLAQDLKDGAGNVLAKAGDPITSEMVQAARRLKIKKLSVRSPLTTKAYDGLYAKDFGRMPGNKKMRPGTDIGIMAGHTLTEPSIQLTLKKFHSGGAGKATDVAGLDVAWDILKGKAPEGTRAPLSPVNARVMSVNKLPSGASDITLSNGAKITTTPGLTVKVKEGDAVKRGQQLQEGNPDPQEVLQYRGHRAMQMYMVDQVEKAFGKHAPDRRYIETIVGNLTRYGEVQDPGDSDYTPGEIVPTNHMRAYNKKILDGRKINFRPKFLGIGISGVKAKSDWLSAMLHGDIGRRLPDMAAAGAVSPIHGVDPTMPFLHSTEFGERQEEGQY